MVRGKDQTFARDFNMKAIMQLLLNEEFSCSELADRCGLSKPAVTKITAEMHELNIITQGDRNDEGVSLGRKRVYLSINPNFGTIAAIDFSTVVVKIQICDMRGKLIEERLIPDSEYLTPEILDKVCFELRQMNASSTKRKELLALCVGASGMVDKVSGQVVISPKFKGCDGIDLRQYFTDKMGCKVSIKNDVNLALLGEHMFGDTQNFSDAFMLFVDAGIGGAVMVSNKIVTGSQGFAGEFGLIRIPTASGYVPLDAICSINAMKDAIRKRGRPDCLGERFHFADVVKAYLSGEPTVVDVVDESAKILSNVIHNLSIVLDSHKAILCGRVRLLGESFLNKVRENAKNCDVNFNLLKDDGVINGAIRSAWNSAIDIVIERR